MASRVRFIETDRKIIALTFDDGWSPTRALQIVDILDQYGVTATFFPYSNAIRGSESTWREIAKRFPIANHTMSHPNMTKLSSAGMFEEIDGARRVIEDATGRPMVRIFRPPYMFYNDTVREQAFRAGFEVMALWSVESGDSSGFDADRIVKRSIAGNKGDIVLLHAGPPATVRALPRIIESYLARGFTFVTLPELLGVPWSPAETTGGPGPTGRIYVRSAAIHRAFPD